LDGKSFFKTNIELNQEDALLVLKSIYSFSNDKGVLNEIYTHAKDYYNNSSLIKQLTLSF